jgi:3'-phosphoadenosine 5'-phosphosulfate sulfotransferase (PAPS reductase)/FAD synthetase
VGKAQDRAAQLRKRQSLALEPKIDISEELIVEWYDHWKGQVSVSFSGGKDSTVLLDLVRSIYPEVPAVFVDTGLEYPEIRNFVKTVDNVVWLKPKMRFREVIEKYGFPVISKEQAQYLHEIRRSREVSDGKWAERRLNGDKYTLSKRWRFLVDAPFKISHKCCNVIKKQPIHAYTKETGRHPIVGTTVSESRLRFNSYVRHGCNMFGTRNPASRPLSIWVDSDIWGYLKVRDLSYSKIYDMGEERTGCMFCCFGVHAHEEPNRFQRMKETHPPQWRYCMDKLGLRDVLGYINVPVEV